MIEYNDLLDAGFDVKQISIIHKIMEQFGINIISLTCQNNEIEDLRKTKDMLIEYAKKNSEYNKQQLRTLATFYLKEHLDVNKFLDMGYDKVGAIRLLLEAEEQNYDLNIFKDKDYNCIDIRLINKYLKRNIDVSEFVDLEIPENLFEICYVLKQNDIDVNLICAFYSIMFISEIYDMLMGGVNVGTYIAKHTPKTTIRQIYKLKKKGLDADRILSYSFCVGEIKVITKAFEDGYDIWDILAKYNDVKDKKVNAENIYECVKYEINPELIKDLEPLTAKLAIMLIKNDLDFNFLKKVTFNENCLSPKFISYKQKIDLLIKYKDCKDVEYIVDANCSSKQLMVVDQILANGGEIKEFIEANINANGCDLLKGALDENIPIMNYIYNGISNQEIRSILILLKNGYTIKKTT